MFENITIVSIDGRPGDCLGAQYAIQKSALELPGTKQVLISYDKPQRLLNGISHYKIQQLNYFEYSIFVLYCLHHYIDTEYALIVQEDGWVLNGKNWSDDFLAYDYVGAPTHFALVSHQHENRYYRQFQWTQFIGKPGYDIRFVQNGGFSLRSQRFLKVFSEFKLPYVLPAPRTYTDPQGVRLFDWHDTESQNEDVYCCIDKRAELEKLGLRFAPLDIALCFAFEHCGAGLHEQANLDRILGHHSRLRRIKPEDVYSIQYNASKEQAEMIYGENKIISVLKKQGARLDFS